ncbi:MAG: hypothetical protein II968_03195 [Selenomonadaceae bacterium]|nr:hypothetical protein [Selenomonadaceae bacterium]
MINADEHKKLLAQITEIERNSVNYFDVEKEFFLIDSDNLLQVRSKLYGYSIQRNGIYEDDNLTPEAIAGLDGRGCYVYVGVKDGEITIKQDLNGCWGIYLFRHGDYFALSNSFFRLLDHIKFKYPLTVNRDYCNYLMISLVAIQSYKTTAVNEISRLERNAVVHVDIAKKDLQIELIDYKEHSVPLNSAEGVAILDRWVEFWAEVFRNLSKKTKLIGADLTGGFDTRIHFVPLLHSGIDLNQLRICSIHDDSNPIFKEDYAIASQIADHYGFKLNQPLPERQALNYSLTDGWNIDLYSQRTMRNLPTSHFNMKAIEKFYHLTGASGEVLRMTWHMPPQQFIEREYSVAKRYSPSLSQKLIDSTQRTIKSVFRSVCDKYHIEDVNSIDIPQYLYHETRSRNHCGKAILSAYLRNTIEIVPSYDSEIQTLQLKSPECPDYNLLMALLFTRYAPDLLKIRFDKFHEAIDIENLTAYAKKINECFPRKAVAEATGGGQFNLLPRDLQAEKILAEGKNNSTIPRALQEKCLKATFESSRTYGLFTAYFDEELYHHAASYYETHDFGRDRPMYAILGVTNVLEAVEISQRNHLPYRDMPRFLEQDYATIHDDSQIADKLKSFVTARIDVVLMAEEDFQTFSVSDSKAEILKPDWYQKNGVGYIIQSYVGNLKIIAKAAVDGQIRISLRGMYVLDPKDKAKHIPYWIDYTKLTVNDKTIFDTLTPAWHDKSYNRTVNVKANEEIKIRVEWLPHRSDT